MYSWSMTELTPRENVPNLETYAEWLLEDLRHQDESHGFLDALETLAPLTRDDMGLLTIMLARRVIESAVL